MPIESPNGCLIQQLLWSINQSITVKQKNQFKNWQAKNHCNSCQLIKDTIFSLRTIWNFGIFIVDLSCKIMYNADKTGALLRKFASLFTSTAATSPGHKRTTCGLTITLLLPSVQANLMVPAVLNYLQCLGAIPSEYDLYRNNKRSLTDKLYLLNRLEITQISGWRSQIYWI